MSCSLPTTNTINNKPIQGSNIKQMGIVTVKFDKLISKIDRFNTKGADFTNVSIKKLRLDVFGLGITTPVSQTIDWTPGATAPFSLSVLAGKNRILVVSALDQNGSVVYSLMGSLNVFAGQNNSGKISYFETATAQVLLNLLNSPKSALLTGINLDDLRTYVRGLTGYDEFTNKFSKIDPLRLNSILISEQIQQNNGALPSQPLTNIDTFGKLNLKLNLIGAKVMINDLNSSIVTSSTDYNTVINNITPGKWTLTILKEGYETSKTDINIGFSDLNKDIELNTGSGRSGGGDSGSKDETGDLGIEKPSNTSTSPKKLFAVYMIGSNLEDDLLAPRGTPDEVTTGTISTLGAGSDDLREIVASLKAMTPTERANTEVIVGFGGARKQGWKGIKYAIVKIIILEIVTVIQEQMLK